MDKILEKIAKEYLNIETLQTQFNDELDFHQVSVWQLKKALEQAWIAGHYGIEK